MAPYAPHWFLPHSRCPLARSIGGGYVHACDRMLSEAQCEGGCGYRGGWARASRCNNPLFCGLFSPPGCLSACLSAVRVLTVVNMNAVHVILASRFAAGPPERTRTSAGSLGGRMALFFYGSGL